MAEKNLFGSFGAAVEDRQTEQTRIEAVAVKAEKEPRNRKRGVDATTMTLTISLADKKRVKAYAAEKNTTVSDLLHQWIEIHCVEG